MRMFAGAKKARGRTIRWLSVLPWPPTGLADGFGRGKRPTPPRARPGKRTHPNGAEWVPGSRPPRWARFGVVRRGSPGGRPHDPPDAATIGALYIRDNRRRHNP